MTTPVPSSYWLVPGQILAGEYPGAIDPGEARAKLRAFLDAGITFFLDLTEEKETLQPYAHLLEEEAAKAGRSVVHRRMGIRDINIPSVSFMHEIQRTIAEALEQGHKVYIHCWGGIGRTGTVAGCYLVDRGISGEEAMETINRLLQTTPKWEKKTPETNDQRRFIREWNREAGRLRRFLGCMLGGAVGDALGAPVEFHSLAAIRQKYGPLGIVDYDRAYGRRGAITDDTQMTLFTAEGMLRVIERIRNKGIGHPPSVMHHAYIRWLHTQGHRSKSHFYNPKEFDGWLIGVKALHSPRAPGNTCLAALSGVEMGTIERPLNDSKGCGGVMRVAPIGLLARDAEWAFNLACEAAAITHGHPSGYFSAGCLAAIIAYVMEGHSLEEAIESTLGLLEREENTRHEECARAIRQALSLWRDRESIPSPEVIERMGGGWVGEEALAISLYCALAAGDDFAKGVLLAVNHSGDSDSTGAIAGNILGAMLGVQAIPAKWLAELELREEIETLARDMAEFHDESRNWWDRYPGW